MLTHGSLSTGICGFDIGAEQNKIRTRWTCEIDTLRQDIIKFIIPKARHYGDILRVKNPAYVDIISFGFPCQDISRAKPNGKGIDGEKSSLWYEGWRIIRTVRPRYVILENSPDLIHKGLRAILAAFAEEGYHAEWYAMEQIEMDLSMIGFEIDPLAFADQEKRFKQFISQLKIPYEQRT